MPALILDCAQDIVGRDYRPFASYQVIVVSGRAVLNRIPIISCSRRHLLRPRTGIRSGNLFDRDPLVVG